MLAETPRSAATPQIAVAGDVVASRRYVDQVALLRGLSDVLDGVNAVLSPVQPLALGHRDQFRGVFTDLGQAVEAGLRLRMAASALVLATDDEDEPVDVRLGIGAGEIVGGDADGASGSAWWCASDALEAALDLPAKRSWPDAVRMVFRSEDPHHDALVNAWLLCQDQLFARMDLRDRRALRGLLDGERQVDIAEDLGITQPAVARRIRDRGALAIVRGLQGLTDLTDPTDSRALGAAASV